jgi:PhoH-like ATPase
MKKFYVLDTNVLIHDPTAILNFQDNEVIVPIDVIMEIDHFKKDLSERGQNARHCSRLLDEFRQQNNLAEGVDLPSGGRLRVVCDDRRGPAADADVDGRILRTADDIQTQHPDAPVVLVTKDINLRIRADVIGLRAEDYETDRVGISELPSCSTELTISREQIDEFQTHQFLPAPRDKPLKPNSFVLLRPENGSKQTALARVCSSGEKLVKLAEPKDGLCGIRPRNMQQYFAADVLLNDQIKLVTMMGKAGTGKTLLAVAAGYHQVINRSNFKALLISRPAIPMGRDLGYLPGGVEEKLNPWIQPITDALLNLMESRMGCGAAEAVERLDDLRKAGRIRIEPLAYIRGRNVDNQFIVVDEVQNLTPLEVKTIVTRIGMGGKVVLTGDPYQIDNPYLDIASSGLTHLIKRFHGEPLAAHVELVKGERSDLAELAANIL